ncbi:helix-turn-helix transcriptional regulator [Streptomyces sp. AK02-04a]|uniref:response regulator transcription factor n=1 Tax=Streptomyces sp. AK02-04a TaxID=3028649 RepID=UPI0029AA5193|nr:helix-turn-helix transcriptional regulator [Streptomyces sp. AK02-04a]MDX3763769.1 helix-turn-helix transcriptional regulator [Streptomyces sp. AK02-04a]
MTASEAAVAEFVVRGLTIRQIAARLKVSPRTVATRLDRVRDKLGIRSRAEIALWLAAQHTAGSDSYRFARFRCSRRVAGGAAAVAPVGLAEQARNRIPGSVFPA